MGHHHEQSKPAMNITLAIVLVAAFAFIWNLRSYTNRDAPTRGAYRSLLVDGGADAVKFDGTMYVRAPRHTISDGTLAGIRSSAAAAAAGSRKFKFSEAEPTFAISESISRGFVSMSSASIWD